jgi:hypothetical protein
MDWLTDFFGNLSGFDPGSVASAIGQADLDDPSSAITTALGNGAMGLDNAIPSLPSSTEIFGTMIGIGVILLLVLLVLGKVESL